jgi:hypothetical protein
VLWLTILFIQGDSVGKVNTLRGDSIGHYEKMNACIIFNLCQGRAVESPNLSPLDFFLSGRKKSEFYKRKSDTTGEFIAGILDALTGIKKSEEQIGRTKGDLRTRVTNCIDFEGGIFVYILFSAVNLSCL